MVRAPQRARRRPQRYGGRGVSATERVLVVVTRTKNLRYELVGV
jgi:hypothetical protein